LISHFERFVAFRYLWRAQGREEGKRFVRFITYMAIGGVAIGVTALLLALAIVRGFSQEIKGKIVSFGAHIQVESFDADPLDDAGEHRTKLAGIEGVTRVIPVVQEFALLRRSQLDIDGVSFRGMTEAPPELEQRIIEGSFSYDADSTGRAGLVIGRQLARLLNLNLGDNVLAFSMRRNADGGMVIGRPRIKPFFVSGIYETSFANFDELFVFTDIDTARDLFEYGPAQVSRFDVFLDDIDRAAETAARIDAEIGFPLYARTVFQVFRQYFAWVNLQESIIPLVIGVIIIVGAVNILATLLMILLEKTNEIGVLSSMGASPKMIQRLFLWLGLFIGGIGMVAGQVLALILAVVQKRYGIIPLPEEAYYMKVAPIALRGFDFLLVGLVALLLCALAAYIPARIASRTEPIRAIRFR
jgi:lipoprotein-releasing system permease protein